MIARRQEVEGCSKIQWGRVHTVNGELVCPECGEPAELIIGFLGNPCYGHKATQPPPKGVRRTP